MYVVLLYISKTVYQDTAMLSTVVIPEKSFLCSLKLAVKTCIAVFVASIDNYILCYIR